jgi:hypothetical protein
VLYYVGMGACVVNGAHLFSLVICQAAMNLASREKWQVAFLKADAYWNCVHPRGV